MKYVYDIVFYLANERMRQELDLREWEALFLDAKWRYNEVGGTTARNKKRIDSLEVEAHFLRIRLLSEISLATPTLALRPFSQYLVRNNPEFAQQAVINGALFRGRAQEIRREATEITDSEVIKRLVDLVIKPKKSEAEKVRLRSIKTLLEEE